MGAGSLRGREAFLSTHTMHSGQAKAEGPSRATPGAGGRGRTPIFNVADPPDLYLHGHIGPVSALCLTSEHLCSEGKTFSFSSFVP